MSTRTFYQAPPELRPQNWGASPEGLGARRSREAEWPSFRPSPAHVDPVLERLLLGLRQNRQGR